MPTSATLPSTDDIIASALAGFGPWGALAALAYKFGAPFVTKLLANAAASKDPTPQEWDALLQSIEVPGEVLIPKRPGA